MGDRAAFEVLLKDKVSRPAARGASAVDKLLGFLGKKSGADKRSSRAIADQVKKNDQLSRSLIRQSRIVERQSKQIIRQTRVIDRQARASARNARVPASRGGGSGSGGGDTFSGMLKFTAVEQGARLAAQAVMATGKKAYDSIATFQDLQLAFRELTKGQPIDGDKLFEHVRAQAMGFGLDVKDTAKQYTKFLALQFTPVEADKLLAVGADLRALGNDAEDISGIFRAMGQIKSKGRLQAEELLQMSERGVSTQLIQEEIGKLMGGKSQQEVIKLQEQGKVTGDVALKAIERALNRKLKQENAGDTGKKFAEENISGMAGRVKATWDNLWLGLGPRAEAKLSKSMGSILSKFDEWARSGEADAFMDRWGDRLNRFNDTLLVAIDLAGSFKSSFASGEESAGGIVSFLDKMSGARGLEESRGTIENLGRALGFVTSVAGGLFGVLRMGYGVMIDTFMTPVNRVIDALSSVSDILSSDASWVDKAFGVGKNIVMGLLRGAMEVAFFPVRLAKNMIDQVLENFDVKDQVYALGKSAVSALADGILSIVGLPGQAIRKVMSLVVGSAKDEIQMHSPPRVFLEMGRATPEAYALGVERSTRVAAVAAVGAGAKASAGFSLGLGFGERERERAPMLERRSNVVDLGEKRRERFGDAPVFNCGPTSAPTPVFGDCGGTSLQINGPLVSFSVDASGATDGEGIAEAISSRLEPELEALFERIAEALGAAA